MNKITKKIVLPIIIILVAGLLVFIFIQFCNQRSLKSHEGYNSRFDLGVFENGKVCLIDKNTHKCISDRVEHIYADAEEDTLTIYELGGKKGYMSTRTGNVIVEAAFDEAWDFDTLSGLAAVTVDGKMGFIKRDGSYFIPPCYAYDASDYEETEFKFKNGFCLVPDADTKKLGVINTNKELVLPIVYDLILDADDGYINIYRDGLHGLTDSAYHILFEAVYGEISITPMGFIITEQEPYRRYLLAFDRKTVITANVFDYVEKLYVKRLLKEEEYIEDEEYELEESSYSKFAYGSYEGVIDDNTGRIIISPVWGSISYRGNNMFEAEAGGGTFIINKEGRIIN